MELITFTFRGLHSETPFHQDLDALYRVVASEFTLTIDTDIVFQEVGFPVLELANALDSWLRSDVRREFSFEPTGYIEPAFRIYPRDNGRTIVSCQRADTSWPVETLYLETIIKRFLKELADACLTLNLDLDGLLARMRQYSIANAVRP